ncbi:hypothetical protein [Streptomyces sp. N2A]|uniref:hypothetical protein n=1 Tax=Streptomyces sp. N2A TaxID=3073936 RepID=UPI0028707932|nr:hypothetical protein [Streptomyces sp. N2A]
MRKTMATALGVVACSALLTLATATTASAVDGAPQCVKVRKYFNKGHNRYVRLTNLCTKRPAHFVIVIPHNKDPRGSQAQGITKDVRYAWTWQPRSLLVKTLPDDS